MDRREFLPLIAAAALSGYAGFSGGRKATPKRNAVSKVAVQRARSYDEDVSGLVRQALAATGPDVLGKRVLLKPQLVAWPDAGSKGMHPANTHVRVVQAVYNVLSEQGAEVRIGAAPESTRDSWGLAEAAGYAEVIPNFSDVFTDLHGDDLVPVEGFNRGELFLPEETMRADLVISLAKLKTDAQYGAALSITNLFGLLPGSVYGLRDPRDGSGFRLSTPTVATELVRFFQRSYAIVDGIVGMEGNGPVEGSAKQAGVLVMGPDLVAVDATCCRLMGIAPADVEYLALAADRQGVTAESRIQLVGDATPLLPVSFRPAA